MSHLFFPSKIPIVLSADDDRGVRLIVRRVMESEGYKVIEANDGRQCLALCQQILPDIILLDAMMPDIDGFGCCEKLHEIYGQDCPPILMMTALQDEESIDRAFVAGAMDYVTKPIHWAVLRQRVRRLIQTGWALSELRHLVSIDQLTQIPNRRCFDERLEQEWLRLRREKNALSLIMCDVDFFKSYNDIYGHPAGDRCLQQVAKIIDRTIKRPADLAARYGGEEFAVILPNTSLSGAFNVAELIRLALRDLNLEHRGSTISDRVTLSLGVACIVPNCSNFCTQLIDSADRALYQAKKTGKDRVVSIEVCKA